MIEDLLAELSSLGWTLSWAFQFEQDHWRISITKIEYWNGYDQPDFLECHCADAPTFAEALENAMSKMAEAEFIEGYKTRSDKEPARPTLLAALGLHLSVANAPIRRRV